MEKSNFRIFIQMQLLAVLIIPVSYTHLEIAKEADFFCFGTNDLTQMTYGFSRDDAVPKARMVDSE